VRISVRVRPNSKIESVEKTSEREFTIRVKAPPTEGRANDAVVKALAEYFDVPKSRVSLSRGASSKIKIFDIL